MFVMGGALLVALPGGAGSSLAALSVQDAIDIHSDASPCCTCDPVRIAAHQPYLTQALHMLAQNLPCTAVCCLLLLRHRTSGFQAILRGKALAKPYACDKFDNPKVTSIDMRLAVGGVLFGAGWGISGMCPGPAVVAAVAMPVAPVLAYVGAMMAGMWVQGVLAPKDKAVKPATA